MTVGTFISWIFLETIKSLGLLLGLAIAALVLIPVVITSLGLYLLKNTKSEVKPIFVGEVEPEVVRDPPNYLDPKAYDVDYFGPRLILRPEGINQGEVREWIRMKMTEAECFRFAWIEELWILTPPVGPAIRAAWADPPVALSSAGNFTVYIVEVDAYLSDGSIMSVFKPGMTGKEKVIGSKGRFSETGKVRRVVTKSGGLSARQAWQVEQKLLTLMPKPPWMPTFDGEVARRTGKESSPEIVEPILSKTDRNRLGPSEWRVWHWGDEELKATLKAVVKLTPHISPSDQPSDHQIAKMVQKIKEDVDRLRVVRE